MDKQGSLFRGAGEDFIGAGPAAVGQAPAPFTLDPWSGALAQQLRQGAGNHFAERVLIIVRCPGQQIEQLMIQQRLFVQQLLDGFQARRLDAAFSGQLHDQAGH